MSNDYSDAERTSVTSFSWVAEGAETEETDYLLGLALHGAGLPGERDAEVRRRACEALVIVRAEEEGER